MLQRKNIKYNDILLSLQNMMGKTEKEIQLSIQNKEKVESAEESLKFNLISADILNTADLRLSTLIEYIDKYIKARDESVNLTIANTFRLATEIVPDSNNEISLCVDHVDKTASVTTREGLSVSETEGSGYKSVLSALLQTRMLMLNKDKLQFIFLDEPFAKVSVENTSILSQYLQLLSEDIQIILVEQKRNALPDNSKLFKFFKIEERTIVEEDG